MNKTNQNLLRAAGVLGLFGAGFVAGKMIAGSGAFGTRRDRATDAPAATLPEAGVLDTLAFALDVFAPAFAKGVIIRRPRVVAMAERLELDRRAVRRMQKLRDKYGRGPLMLCLPIRKQAIVFSPEHVQRVLDESPEPFATASSEKRAALSHFEPQGVLVSHGPQRAVRRRFNEAVLESERPAHHLADRFLPIVEEEAGRMLAGARAKGELDWDTFADSWFRLVRRVVFGEGARDDHELDELTVQLRKAANWAFLHPKKSGVQERFFARIAHYLERAEPGSLAAVIARLPKTADTMPHQQVPQWLFAFDAAGMTTFRALALLASHPERAARAREELRANPGMQRQYLPFLRATVLEAVRLWPTTPMILRQSTRETRWETGTMPARTGVMLFTPFFHRDDQRLPYADRFTPELWLEEGRRQEWPLVPFSGGPATCPARNLVLMLASAMLAALLEGGPEGHPPRLVPADRLDPARLPGTLDNYTLRFAFGA